MDWKIPLYKIHWDEADVRLVTKAIQRGTHWAIGPNIDKLEGMIAAYLGVKHALVFNSGTSALHAVMLACDIGVPFRGNVSPVD
jgi:dTDP-4-amino-4,6-dideoxygalactose transaminase